jgi:hypothetical protein
MVRGTPEPLTHVEDRWTGFYRNPNLKKNSVTTCIQLYDTAV